MNNHLNKILIFSMNRSLQLDLLLRSIRENFKEIEKIYILYKYSNDSFKKGYELIQERFENIEMILENNFTEDFLKILKNFNKYFLAFADDDVVIRNQPLSKILNVLDNNLNCSCISLRLNQNTNFCYTQNRKIEIPKFIYNKDYLLWNWTKENKTSEWGYPSNITGHIFRKKNVLPIFNLKRYKAPNSLEGLLSRKRGLLKPLMCSYKNSKVVNITCNRVQKETNIKFGKKFRYSTETLNNLYLDNHIIRTNMYDYNNNAPHIEFKFEFIKI